jgi:hypothetical protein
MANVNLLPNFLIIGAAKSGTTALYDLLKQHPQVYLPFDKEPLFFSRDDYFSQGADWYVDRYFKESESFRVRGEATPHYLYWAEKVASRIAQTFGTRPPKFIAIFRDPVQRAYSWYWNMVREGFEKLPFEAALEAEPRILKERRVEFESFGLMTFGYVRGGRYATQLESYLALFPRERFLFLLQEDLKPANLNATMRRVFDFLEVDADVHVHEVTSNPAVMPRSRFVHTILHRGSRLKEWLKRQLPYSLRYRIKQTLTETNMQTFDYPPLDPKTATRLRVTFADEVQRLSTLIGRDLSRWMKTS